MSNTPECDVVQTTTKDVGKEVAAENVFEIDVKSTRTEAPEGFLVHHGQTDRSELALFVRQNGVGF